MIRHLDGLILGWTPQQARSSADKRKANCLQAGYTVPVGLATAEVLCLPRRQQFISEARILDKYP